MKENEKLKTMLTREMEEVESESEGEEEMGEV